MSHQDQGCLNKSGEQHQELNRAIALVLKGADFSAVQWRSDCRWSVRGLVTAAILWAWSGEGTLTGRFEQARKISLRMLQQEHVPAESSYQAFMKLLLKWTTPLIVGLALVFRQRIEVQFADRWRVGGFVAFGVDGSRFELPRTAANEAYFAPSNNSKRRSKTTNGRKSRGRKSSQSAASRLKKASNPQMWVTTIWHLGVGLPWSWRLGPSNSSEREHLKQMLSELPAGSLIVADAGFYGYDLWRELLAGHHLLIRVGSNVRLLKKLCYVKEKHGLVYCWPDRAAAKSQPPLMLRLVVAHNGKHPVYLVTSVQDEKQLSDNDVAEVYGKRWGIELYYRHVKQTFDRTKLRSHSPQNALLEAEWSLVGLWAMTIHAQYQLQLQQLDPQRLSIANMLRAYRAVMYEYRSIPDKGERLSERLKHAMRDTYERRSKVSRNYSRKKQEQAAGPPVIKVATKAQVQQAKQIKRAAQKGLAA